MQQILQTGAGVKLLINGSVVGFATGINFSRSQGIKVTYEIDNPFPVELAPTTYLVQGALTGLRLRDSGGLDGGKIMDISTPQKFFLQKYVSIEIVDRVSGKTLFTIQKAMFDQDSWTIAARQMIGFNATFKGVFVENEASEQS